MPSELVIGWAGKVKYNCISDQISRMTYTRNTNTVYHESPKITSFSIISTLLLWREFEEMFEFFES